MGDVVDTDGGAAVEDSNFDVSGLAQFGATSTIIINNYYQRRRGVVMLSKKSLKKVLSDVGWFSQYLLRDKALRAYQLDPARAIVKSILDGGGEKFVICFSRQSGKDEMLAQLMAYLLTVFQAAGGQIVVGAPTKRQADISRERVAARLGNPLTDGDSRLDDYILRLGKANARFLSADPSSNARGETASLLLVANEAQDIIPARWDAVFDPMAASTNATTLFMGTPWTSATLLAREMRYLRATKPENLFMVDWKKVAEVNPAYGQRVQSRINQFGVDHPFVQTEYFLKEIGEDGFLFNPARQESMRGTHARQTEPVAGAVYALLIDVAGEEEDGAVELGEINDKRDSTAITVVEVLPGANTDLPVYRAVNRFSWVGAKHVNLFGVINNMISRWNARYIVVDSTGVGAGLSSFLLKRWGERRVLPFIFSSKSKSDLGWDFISLIDGGRYQDYVNDGVEDTGLFWRQVRECDFEIRPGPGKLLRWSVPNVRTHDDLLISAALVAVLDKQDWRTRIARVV
jgi:hypothetical protein